MSKLIGLAFVVTLLLLSANLVREKFAKYRAIEAYEIRPGILMMPRYSVDGQVCEIGLEKWHYSPERIRLDSRLSREEIDQVFDELVPGDERGPRSKNFGESLITQSGHSIVTTMDFKNVSIQFFSEALPASSHGEMAEGDIAATVRWKNRKCR